MHESMKNVNSLEVQALGSNSTHSGEHNEIPCAEEQIRIPGSVQPHGILLGIDPELEIVLFASENAAEFFRVPLKLILGSTIDLFLDRELLASVRLLHCALDPVDLVTYLGAFTVRDELCSVVTHCVDGQRILEFERQDRLIGLEMMNGVMTNFVGTLSRLSTEAELCQAITRQFQILTGFDRVLLYSFDAAGHGTVLAEENNGTLPSYLHLRFPASDIPQQARALYVSNTVRIIPDAAYRPVPLQGLQDKSPERLDMSLCVLRSVSPVHLEYMRNMGTLSSMSVSILCEGRLWGLISGHHAEPRAIPYLVRSACDMLTKMVGTQLTSFQTTARMRTMVRFHDVQRRMLTRIAAEKDYLSAVAAQMELLMEVTDSTGAVLAVDGEFSCAGATPDVGGLRRITEWLDTYSTLEFYETNQLSAELPWAADLTGVASGLLAIRISDVRRQYILWFRPEVISTVRWAGEPVKAMDQAKRLHPRLSFETWKETLRGQGLAWQAVEVESAREFRAGLTSIGLRRTEEEAELGEARFDRLTQALPIKVFAVSDDGHITYTNELWRNAGLPEQGLWYESTRIAEQDVPRIAVSWAHAIESATGFEEEVRLVAPGSDAEYWNLIRLISFSREGAKRAGWIGACIDLTERKQRETALKVTEKLALTGRMTSFLAHEINNPLAAITNVLYLLKQDSPQSTKTSAYFKTVEEELERISGSVKQTLRWGSENAGEKSWIAAGSLFEDALRLFATKIRNREVRAAIEGDATVQVFGVISQLRQVIAHLVSNALDAVPVRGKVWLKAE